MRFDPARVAPPALVGAVEAAAYHAALPGAEPGDDARGQGARVLFAAALSLPVLLLSMVFPLQFEYW